MIVHQVLAGAGPHDAVTGQARLLRARFHSWGWGGADHATYIVPGMNGAVRPRAELHPAPGDVVLVHHAAVTPQLDRLLDLPNPRVVVYHNITPAEWLWDVAPALAVQCAVGREQLPALVRDAAATVGVSRFNVMELASAGATDPRVVPLIVELDRLGPPGRRPRQGGAPQILFVGRLSPHKRQEDLIRVIALLRAHRAPQATLMLVGDPVTAAYGAHLRALAERVAPGAVTFAEGLSDAGLGECYRSADAFLCLSEHEGFCLPLVEALRFGLPVVARAAGAVPETLGEAGLLLEPGDDLGTAAELLHLVLSETGLREELAARGAARLPAYAPDTAAEQFQAVIEAAASR